MSSLDSNVIAIGIGALSLITTIIVAFVNRENEHRLTTLEHSVFTRDERDKFLDTCFKMTMLWEFYEKQLPILLKNPLELDELFERASVDAALLTKDEKKILIDYLRDKAESDDINKRYMAKLYIRILNSKGVLKEC